MGTGMHMIIHYNNTTAQVSFLLCLFLLIYLHFMNIRIIYYTHICLHKPLLDTLAQRVFCCVRSLNI